MPPTPANPIDIYYPNGGNLAVQLYVYDTGSNQPVLWNGASTFSGTISIGTISGSKSNNAGVPGSTNLGVLPALCTTVSAGYIEGNQVLLVTDTTGALKVNVSSATVNNTTGNPVPVTVQNTTVNAVVTSIPAVNVTVSNTTFNIGNTANVTVVNTTGAPVPVTVQNTVTITGTVAISTTTINATISNTSGNAVPVTVQNTTVNALITSNTSIAYSNGSVSSTTQRVVQAVSTPYVKAALTSTVNTVTSSPGVLTAYMVLNPNASAAYLQIFDTTSPTMGSTTPKYVISLPASAAANVAGLRVNFTTAITIGASTTFSGSTGPSTGLDVSMSYE